MEDSQNCMVIATAYLFINIITRTKLYQLQIFASYGSIVDGSSPQWSFLIVRRVWKETMYGVTTHPLFCPHWAISFLLFCNPLSCLYSI